LTDAPHRLGWDDVRVSTVPAEAALSVGYEKVVEFSPTADLQKTLEVVSRNMEAGVSG
jgi:hypothetical protein